MRNKFNWRGFLSRLALPMLAVSASFGVYRFALLFVPVPIAIIQAGAFELTYVGLAVVDSLTENQRKRATAISIGAVVVSILYNSLSGLFDRNPSWLVGLPWPGEIGLAVLHGAPLAWVAYLVASLLLHNDEAQKFVPAEKYEQLNSLHSTLFATYEAKKKEAADLFTAVSSMYTYEQVKELVDNARDEARREFGGMAVQVVPQHISGAGDGPKLVPVNSSPSIDEVRALYWSGHITFEQAISDYGVNPNTARGWRAKKSKAS